MSGGTLVGRYDAVVCDLDGVVYRGPTAVPHAVEVLGALEVPVIYATNNASRSPDDVAAHLRELGLRCSADAVATSSQAGAWLLGERLPAGAAVLAVGGAGVAQALAEAGLRAVLPAEAADGAVVQAVLQGYGPGCHRHRPGRGGLRRRGRGHLGRDQHRRHPPDRPRGGAGQRVAGRRGRARRRQPAGPGGREAAAPAVPDERAAAGRRGRPGAGRGRPARHRHRGRGRGRDGLAARADRGRRPAGLPRRTRVTAADVGGSRPALTAGRPAGRRRDPGRTDLGRARRVRRARRRRRARRAVATGRHGAAAWSAVPHTGSVGGKGG